MAGLSLRGYFREAGYTPNPPQEEFHFTPSRMKVFKAGRRVGKAIDANESIATPVGFRRFGDLVAGDLVFDERGQPCRVIETFDETPDECYRLTFSDGETLDACADHQWVTWTHRQRKEYLRADRVRAGSWVPPTAFPRDWASQPATTTRQIVDTLTFGKRADNNHCIPLNGSLRQPASDLPIDPWLLGYWIGNGGRGTGGITSDVRDAEWLDAKIRGLGYSHGMKRVTGKYGQAYSGTVYGLLTQLKSAGLDGKVIPAPYLWGAEDQRRALLAGLIDSDGHMSPTTGKAEFCSMDPQLALDVQHLLRSLGERAAIYTGRAMLRGVDHGEKYRVYWRPTSNPFTSPRKAGAYRAPEKHALQLRHRMIVGAALIPSKPMRCITVDSPSSMYLIGRAMIPTHNTLAGGMAVQAPLLTPCPLTGEGQVGWIVGPTYALAEKEFRIIYDTWRRMGIDKECIRFQKSSDGTDLHIKTEWGAELVGKSAQHPEKLVGEGLNFALLVEAGLHRRHTWTQYIRPALSDRRGWAIFSGVPEGKSDNSLLYALDQRGVSTRPEDAAWRSFRAPSWANTVVFPGGRQDPEILDAENDLTEAEFLRQYGAEFVDGVGTVFQEFDENIHVGDFDYAPGWKTVIAVDWGWTDPTRVLFIQEGPFGDIRVIKEREYFSKDSPDVARDLLATEGSLVRAASMLYGDPAEPGDNDTLSKKLRVPQNRNTGGALKIRLDLIARALKVKPELRHLPDDHPDRVPTMMIDRFHCPKLIWEMRSGYKWPEKRADVPLSDKDSPVDGDNHSVEALGRYYRGRFGSVGKIEPSGPAGPANLPVAYGRAGGPPPGRGRGRLPRR